MEIPVVTSPLAADGIQSSEVDESPVHVARSPGQYAEFIIRQLLDENPGRVPYECGRQYVARHFAWPRSGELLAHALSRALATSL
jgi:hypothetical protein